MSPLNIWIDTLSLLKSAYFFIANTNKVESNKMIAMSFRTFIIKVLIFIFIYLLSFSRLEDDTHIKCSCQNYIISKFIKQANRWKVFNILKSNLKLILIIIVYKLREILNELKEKVIKIQDEIKRLEETEEIKRYLNL